MIYKVKITYKVFNFERVPVRCLINTKQKIWTCLNFYDTCIDILVN